MVAAQCPYTGSTCWATDRERLMLAFVRGGSSFIPKAGTILNVAPEPSLTPSLPTTAIDPPSWIQTVTFSASGGPAAP